MSKRAAGLIILMVLTLGACSPRTPMTPAGPVSPTERAAPIASVPVNTELPIPSQPIFPTSAPIDVTASPEIVSNSTAPANQPQLTTTIRYRLQIGSPVGVANFIDPQAGCNWLGIGGQAFDLSGTPVTDLVVEVGGTLEGSDVFHLSLTGSSSLLGPGSFVIVLTNHVVPSDGTLWILLYDLAGQPLTDKIPFATYADCTKNLILINFSEVPANFQPRSLLPLILK